METVNGVRITCLPGSGGIVLSYYAQDCPPQEKMARIQAILYRKDGTMLQCTITLTDNASQGDGYDIDETAGVMLWNENGIVSPVYTRRVTITSDGGTKIEFVEDSPVKKSDHISNALTQITSAVK